MPNSVTTVLRMRASFAEARRNHAAGAVVGAAALPLALLGIPVALLVAGGVGAVIGAVVSYRMRVRGVERRLARVLDAVAAPPAPAY